MRTCKHPGCEGTSYSKGYCNMHYRRSRSGRDMDLPPRKQRSLSERFWQKVDKGDEAACWLWTGGLTTGGYGHIKAEDRSLIQAHRYSYEVSRGLIPAGMQIDHVCRERRCVNPNHLRLATPKQNSENRLGPVNGERPGVRVLPSGSFIATVRHWGKSHYLGTFATAEEAAEAARAKRCELFTFNDLDRRVANETAGEDER